MRQGAAAALSTPIYRGCRDARCCIGMQDHSASSAGQDAAPGETSSGHGAPPAPAAGRAAHGGSLRRSFLGSGEGHEGHPQGQLKCSSGSGALPGGGGGARSCGEKRGDAVLTCRGCSPPTSKAQGWDHPPITEGLEAGLGGQQHHLPAGGGRLPGPESSARCPCHPAGHLEGSGGSAQLTTCPPPTPSPFSSPPAPALTSQRCFGRGAGGQAGPGHEARRGEGRWGRRRQLLRRQSQDGWEEQGGRPPTSTHGTRCGGSLPTPRGRGDPSATDLPGCLPGPGELLHHQGGEDADAAIEVARPEAVVHLAGSAGQHPDDGPLGEAQFLGALPLVVVQGSHQPGCGEDGVGGSASPRHQPRTSVPVPRGGDTPAPTSGLQHQLRGHDAGELAVQGRGSWGVSPSPHLAAQGQQVLFGDVADLARLVPSLKGQRTRDRPSPSGRDSPGDL